MGLFLSFCLLFPLPPLGPLGEMRAFQFCTQIIACLWERMGLSHIQVSLPLRAEG